MRFYSQGWWFLSLRLRFARAGRLGTTGNLT